MPLPTTCGPGATLRALPLAALALLPTPTQAFLPAPPVSISSCTISTSRIDRQRPLATGMRPRQPRQAQPLPVAPVALAAAAAAAPCDDGEEAVAGEEDEPVVIELGGANFDEWVEPWLDAVSRDVLRVTFDCYDGANRMVIDPWLLSELLLETGAYSSQIEDAAKGSDEEVRACARLTGWLAD